MASTRSEAFRRVDARHGPFWAVPPTRARQSDDLLNQRTTLASVSPRAQDVGAALLRARFVKNVAPRKCLAGFAPVYSIRRY